MRGNNKGFTLVELLAALVILSVLAIVALPTVVNLLGNSRDKLYVTDAKKLISQAEYKIRAASSEIEKPDNGECLILSMVYLDNSDFDKAPNNGEYIREASYVIVKNNNGNYEYSVELVEKLKKGGFKGVELSKGSSLSSTSTRHVVAFNKNKLYFVENNDAMGKYNGNQVDTQYINSKLGDSYVSKISKVYNHPDLAESTYNANYAIPRIIRAEYVSASNKNFNSLDSILKLVVTDSDTPTDKLNVIVGSGRNGIYPNVNADYCEVSKPYDFGKDCKYNYGVLKDFSLQVNFADNGYFYDGNEASLYVMVVDPEGNTDKLNPKYKIHTNEAPVIDKIKSRVLRKSSDSKNLSTAVLRLYVSDDSTPNSDLMYCISEDKDATSCKDYKHYSDFKNSELTYTFNCGSHCSYDGSLLNLKVFLKDNDANLPLESTAVFSYKLYQNDIPSISSVQLYSESLPFVTDNSLALKASVKLKVDDSSSTDNISITLAEDSNFSKNVHSYSYSDFNSTVNYTFSGYYDGLERTLYVKATDEYGATSTYKKVYGKVHKNKKPVVEKIEFVSENILEKVCPSSKICNKYKDNGGAYEAVVNVTASDDLVSEDKLYVCISTDATDCEDHKSSNFLPYDSGKSKDIHFPISDRTRMYDGESKTVYVVLYDGYAESIDGSTNLAQYSERATGTYKIYKNQPPEINEEEFTITSKKEEFNDKNVVVNFKVIDDLDAVNSLKYTLKDDKGETKTGTVTAHSVNDNMAVEFKFGGNYDGVDRTLTLEVVDSYGSKKTITKTYNVHKNDPPHIDHLIVESNENPCEDVVCQNENSLKTTVKLKVTDDLTSNTGDLNVCLQLNSGVCSDYRKLNEFTFSDGEYLLPYTIPLDDSLPYKGQEVNIIAYVKDEQEAVSHINTGYYLYNNSVPMIDNAYPNVKSTNYESTGDATDFITNINPNLSTVNFKLKATDDFLESSQLKFKVCYVTDPYVDITGTSGVTCLNNGNTFDYSPDDNGAATVELDLGVTSYTGQVFYLFAKVYDDYALSDDRYVSYSSLASYQVYQDVDPQIDLFTVKRSSDSSNLDISFKVSDPLDTYKVCVSESLDSCSDYDSTTYSGDYKNNEDDIHTTTYEPSWGSDYIPGRHFLYLFVKDSHDNYVTNSSYPDRESCTETTNESGEVIDSGKVGLTPIYEINAGSQELTSAKCNKKCYYWPESDTASLKAYYTKTISYVDKNDSSKTCGNPEVITDYEAHCNFRTCYYNYLTRSYKATAIGYVKHENTESTPYIHNDGDSSHKPSYYRYEYITDYDATKDKIVLSPTGNKICGDCYDSGKYKDVIVTYDNNEEIGG